MLMNDDEDVIDAAASEFLDQEANLAEALESGTETISDNVMDALYNEQCSGKKKYYVMNFVSKGFYWP